MIEVKYDTSIEVSEEEYIFITNKFRGTVAHRKSNDGKFFIKVWSKNVIPYIYDYLNRKK